MGRTASKEFERCIICGKRGLFRFRVKKHPDVNVVHVEVVLCPACCPDGRITPTHVTKIRMIWAVAHLPTEWRQNDLDKPVAGNKPRDDKPSTLTGAHTHV